MKATIEIEKVNYFTGRTYDNDFNAKVLYRKNGKLHLCHIFIDFFNKDVFVGKQAKECKVLAGFTAAIREWAKKEYKF